MATHVENDDVNLEVIDQAGLPDLTRPQHEVYLPIEVERNRCRIPEPLRSSLMPPITRQQWIKFALLRLPILNWLWFYKSRYLVGDVIAGITVSVMHIPQGLAYALLANLPPVYGLYTSFMPPIVYAVFGTSRHLALGTFAVVSLMVGNAIQRLVDSNGIPCLDEGALLINGSNATNSTDMLCESFKRDVAVSIAFSSGIILISMSIFQLGFVSLFLSSALVSGYTTGAAVHVATSQIRHLLDIPQANISVPPGVFNIPKVWISIAQNVVQRNVNVATIIISLVSCIFLIVIRNVNLCLTKWKLYKKLPIPIPAQLILIICATVISYFVGLNQRWNVSIVNKIAGGPPPFTVPVGEHMLSTLPDAITIAFVTFAVSVSLSQVFAKRNKYEITPNQELFAYGITSVCSSFFSSYSPSGSLSRSLVQETVGGKTQLVGLISSSILLAVIYLIAPLFEPLPKAILSSIVIVALYGMFKQFLHLRKYWKLSKADFLVWIVVFISTVLLGVDFGLLAGVLFSLAMVIARILLPVSFVLGYNSSEDEQNKVICTVPGILIFRSYGPICYLNAGIFRSKLTLKAQVNPAKYLGDEGVGCWKAAYDKARRVKKRRQADEKASNVTDIVSEPVTPTSITGPVPLVPDQQPSICLLERSVMGNTQYQLDRASQHTSVAIPNGADGSEESLHTIIMDCSALSFVDSVGAEVLQQIVADYEEVKVQVLFASVPEHVFTMFERDGFLKKFGKKWFFPSIKSAMDFVLNGGRLIREKNDSEASSSDSSQEVVDGQILTTLELSEVPSVVNSTSDSHEDSKQNISRTPFIRLRRFIESRV